MFEMFGDALLHPLVSYDVIQFAKRVMEFKKLLSKVWYAKCPLHMVLPLEDIDKLLNEANENLRDFVSKSNEEEARER
jgi:hypothetical protein